MRVVSSFFDMIDAAFVPDPPIDTMLPVGKNFS
jgi:hypothetical protein